MPLPAPGPPRSITRMALTLCCVNFEAQSHRSVIDGLPALHYAVYKNNEAFVTLLLDNGIDIACKDRYDKTALDYATLYESEEMIRLLMQRGAHTANLDYKSNL